MAPCRLGHMFQLVSKPPSTEVMCARSARQCAKPSPDAGLGKTGLGGVLIVRDNRCWRDEGMQRVAPVSGLRVLCQDQTCACSIGPNGQVTTCIWTRHLV